MKKALVLFIVLFSFFYCYGQLDDIRRLQRQLPLIHDSLRYVDALNRLGMLSYENNVDSTFNYTVLARGAADRLQYSKGKADASTNLGVVFDMKGNLQLALRYYNDAYIRYRNIGDSANMVQCIMNIAMVYQEIGKNQKAIADFKEAITLGEKLKHDSIMSLVWYNYILQYPDNISEDSISIDINKAIQIATKYKDKRALLAIQQVIADNFIKNGQRNKGLKLLEQTVFDGMQISLYYMSMDILIDLADQYATIDSAKAVAYYHQGLAIANQKGYRVYTTIFIRKLYDFYIGKNDSSAAFHYSKLLLNLYDEQEKVNNNSGVDYIEYALKDQQLESARIQSGYRLKFLTIAVLLCISAIVLLIVLWRNWKQLQKITKALRLEFDKSESTMEALDAKNKDYAKVIKIVAHDLLNPIGAITTISSMMQAEDIDQKELQELMTLVETASKSCIELINELLKTDFDQQQNFKKEKVKIDELLQQCVYLLSFRAKDKNQHLVLNNSIQVTVEGDYEKLWRVVNNLIVNAIKFSPEGAEIHIDTQQLGQEIRITVKDSGIGIPANMQDKIFDPFTNAKREGTKGEQPFGLGLYISKQIIEAHNGKIGFKSEEWKGTEFYVELAMSDR